MGNLCSPPAKRPVPQFPEGMSREDMMKEVFKYTDDDKSGGISLKEYKQLGQKLDDPATNAIMADVFDQADKAGWFSQKDGVLTLEEFTEFNLASGKSLDDAAFRKQASMWLQLAKAR
uniref:EF-hand domain-containing protein n=1 Tax=Alexandrium catenella TaxID=2925 RepID=A0A7S1KYN9_ALECA|mmetsp:Transcript_103088/g.274084  ORF Transcript_103088/g.274084 Transcript_103088/m.274084 type:complete len:118 (+) Transcript_103088:44-397(+)